MTKLTHPADGLYYVTHDMLKKAGACGIVGYIKAHFGANNETPIPITLKNTRWLDERYGGLYWGAFQMVLADKITSKEHDKFEDAACWGGTPAAFMDLLLSRAKREGLVK